MGEHQVANLMALAKPAVLDLDPVSREASTIN
jgi:hypothetical protein